MGHRRQLTSRALHAALGEGAREIAAGGAPLELTLPAQETSRTRDSALLRDATMRAHPVGDRDDGDDAFGAFLDGVQESRVVAYVGTIPIVHARAGAVIRARVDRRLVTWGDGLLSDDALYLPIAATPPDLVARLVATGCPVIDTTDDTTNDSTPIEETHPQQMLRRAVHLVQRGRESLERTLAEAWCSASPASWLYVDGGLPASDVVLGSGVAVGIIKSHHTLYATGAALATVMSLCAAQRSSILVIETRWRDPVASWYLRLRPPGMHDPLWGMVRVECPLDVLTQASDNPDAACDRISRRVLAEASPLSLPDMRWDTMAYGIRDCEVYLRAALGRLAT